MPVDSQSVEAWARKILEYDEEAKYQELLDELGANRELALGLLDRLADFGDPIVRAWAGTAAKAIFGTDVVPVLTRLSKDRDPDVRDVARQDTVAPDPAFQRPLFPAFRPAPRQPG